MKNANAVEELERLARSVVGSTSTGLAERIQNEQRRCLEAGISAQQVLAMTARWVREGQK